MPEQEDMKCGQYIGTYGKFFSTLLKNFTYTNYLKLAPFANEINKKSGPRLNGYVNYFRMLSCNSLMPSEISLVV